MHDGAALTWRQAVEKHHAGLIDEIGSAVEREVRAAVSRTTEAEKKLAQEQTEKARREAAELLNQILRRLRQMSSAADVFGLAVEASAPFAEKLAVLSFTDGEATLEGSRGLAAAEASAPFTTGNAAAIASAISSKDLVVTFASAGEISTVLAGRFGAREDQKAYLFPVLERQTVTAMLVASGEVKPAALEVIAEACGMKLEALTAQGKPVLAPLPSHAFAAPSDSTETTERPAWSDLSAEDQKLHLQAQRVARVRVAEIRLYRSDALRKGIAESNIYGSVASEIDAARTEFLQSFLSKSPTMVDYLHLEILRSLAHDDDRLLGQNYPGPMV